MWVSYFAKEGVISFSTSFPPTFPQVYFIISVMKMTIYEWKHTLLVLYIRLTKIHKLNSILDLRITCLLGEDQQKLILKLADEIRRELKLKWKTGNEFCTVERFRRYFWILQQESLNLTSKNTEDLYMINKENQKFVFLKCNSDSYLYYDDLDVLLQTAYIDWFNILDNWKYLWAIMVDGTLILMNIVKIKK